MLFSSIPFLFYFLPCVILLYIIAPKCLKNTTLLLSSLVFYAWGEPRYVIWMVLSIALGYIFGLLIEHFKSNRALSRLFIILSVGSSLAMLGYFKYVDFFITNFNAVTGLSVPLLKIALPIGISFYTFQILSYTVDVYRGDVAAQKNPIDLAAYVALFPQLIAGPIVRYSDVADQLKCRTHTVEKTALGARRFLVGLGKKILIANVLGELCDTFRASDDKSVLFFWLYAIAYSLHLYFDFSGYSDMAIGLGRMFGFHFLENFNYPYIATSITDFWRRWHISLSSWFRDYIYIPLGGNRVKKPRFVFNILVVWTLTGFWHGAEWNFVLWGLYYGLILLGEKLLWGKFIEKLPKAIGWIYSMFFVLIGWVIFNITDMGVLWSTLCTMFGFVPTNFGAVIGANTEILIALSYLPIGIVCMLPWENKIKLPEKVKMAVSPILHIALLFVCVVYTISSSYNPFIYFRF